MNYMIPLSNNIISLLSTLLFRMGLQKLIIIPPPTHLHTWIQFQSYTIGYQRGYQKTGIVQSVVTTKLKGAWRYNGNYGDYTQNCASHVRETTFDVADFVIPPKVNFCTGFNLSCH